MNCASSSTTARGRPARTSLGLRNQLGFRTAFGFTLIELLVTVAVLTILTAAATPSFTSLVNQNRLSAAANEMVASLQMARSEAMRRNARTVICHSSNPDADEPTCTAAAGDWSGWIVFVDDGNGTAANAGNGSRQNGEAVLRRQSVVAPVQVRPSEAVSSNANAIEFRADGRAKDSNHALLKAKIGVCIASRHPAENNRDVALAFGSRVSVDRRDGKGACDAPSNS